MKTSSLSKKYHFRVSLFHNDLNKVHSRFVTVSLKFYLTYDSSFSFLKKCQLFVEETASSFVLKTIPHS